MKKMISLFSAALFTVGMSTTAFAAELNVSVEGTPVAWTDAKPFIDENSRTLVPLRPIANALGLEVGWDDDKNQASFTDGETTIVFTIGEKEYYVFLNENPDFNFTFETDTAAVIANERTYAPARYLAECFQYSVGWDEPTKSVTIVKADAPAEETILLPKVPEGELAATFPVVAEANAWVTNYIAFNGVTLAEDADIFAYSIEAETPMNGFGTGYSLMAEDNYIAMDMNADFSVPAGTYPVTFTIPKEFFTDAAADVVVSTTMTVKTPSAKTAVALAADNIQYGMYVYETDDADAINAVVSTDTEWLFTDTSFRVTASNGAFIYDEEGVPSAWECTITATNSETGENASTDVIIPLFFYPDEYTD